MSDFLKDPNAVLDYKFDWAPNTNGNSQNPDWLASGETISTFSVTADSGLTLLSSGLTDSSRSVTIWVSGGQVGKIYNVGCHIITNLSPTARQDDRTMRILVRQR